MQQNYTNAQTQRERKKEREREKEITILTAIQLGPCLVSTAPSVESCKMSPVYPDLSCLLQERR